MFEVSLSFSLSSRLSANFTNQPQTNQTQNPGQWKRALVSALSVGLGAIGGVTGYVLLRFLLLHLLLFIHHQYHLFPFSETTTTDGKMSICKKKNRSMVFRTQDQPHYTPGIATCITAAGLIMVIVVLLNITFMRANKRAAAGGEPVEGLVGFR